MKNIETRKTRLCGERSLEIRVTKNRFESKPYHLIIVWYLAGHILTGPLSQSGYKNYRRKGIQKVSGNYDTLK